MSTIDEQEEAKILNARVKYIEHQYDQGKQLDQNVFILSSGIFGVSFSFISELIKTPLESTKPLLITSWSLIAISIITSLIGYYMNFYSYKQKINEQDEKLKCIYEPKKELPNKTCKYPKLNAFKLQLVDKCPYIFNFITLSTLIVGIVYLLSFVGKNY
jgi:hypothetical protein